jgi:ATP-dependent helicase HrpA
VNSLPEFRDAHFEVRVNDFVSPTERKQLRALPVVVPIRNREVEITYDVEPQPGTAKSERVDMGVIRLRLPEKLARTLSEEELPHLDRPLRFLVAGKTRRAVDAG